MSVCYLIVVGVVWVVLVLIVLIVLIVLMVVLIVGGVGGVIITWSFIINGIWGNLTLEGVESFFVVEHVFVGNVSRKGLALSLRRLEAQGPIGELYISYF